jgi:hypothetical protein
MVNPTHENTKTHKQTHKHKKQNGKSSALTGTKIHQPPPPPNHLPILPTHSPPLGTNGTVLSLLIVHLPTVSIHRIHPAAVCGDNNDDDEEEEAMLSNENENDVHPAEDEDEDEDEVMMRCRPMMVSKESMMESKSDILLGSEVGWDRVGRRWERESHVGGCVTFLGGSSFFFN